jgi:hypothetical protein
LRVGARSWINIARSGAQKRFATVSATIGHPG